MCASTIRLIEDIGALPQFKESLHSAPELKNNTLVKVSGASTMTGGLDSVIDRKEDSDELELNAFAKRSGYNLAEQEEEVEIIQPIKFYQDKTQDIMQMISQLAIQQPQPMIDQPQQEEIKHPISFVQETS